VSDIFQEVDEEVRREQLMKLWERYQGLIIAVVALIIIGVGGWRGYEYWESQRAAEVGTAFEQAMTLAESGKHAEAEAAYDKIAKDGSASYRVLARLRAAAEIAERDQTAAVAAYEAIAADRSVGPVMQDLASLRASALQIDTAAYDKAKARLEPLTATGRPFRHSARELLALAAWRSGDAVAAKRWFDLIMTDAETPQPTRSRVEMLNALGAPEAKG
jgi:hypothetical protein